MNYRFAQLCFHLNSVLSLSIPRSPREEAGKFLCHIITKKKLAPGQLQPVTQNGTLTGGHLLFYRRIAQSLGRKER